VGRRGPLGTLELMDNTQQVDHTISMVYGSEAVLYSKLQYGSPRVQAYQPVKVEQAWQDVIDLLKELRDIAVARSVRYQQTLRQYQAQRVHPRAFQIGDLVMC
jgi:hypothetical protein